MNIILCGMPISGKTTIGKSLAQKLNYDFIDTDRLIEKTYQAKMGQFFSCREIFQKNGEENFRILETEQIAELKFLKKTIIALGGGSLIDKENVKFLKSLGQIFYLKVPLNELLKRLGERETPAFLQADNPRLSYELIAKKREPIFEAAADVIININNLHEEKIISEIIGKLGKLY